MVIWRRITIKNLRRLLQELPERLRWHWVVCERLVIASPRGRPWLLQFRRSPNAWFLAPLEEVAR